MVVAATLNAVPPSTVRTVPEALPGKLLSVGLAPVIVTVKSEDVAVPPETLRITFSVDVVPVGGIGVNATSHSVVVASVPLQPAPTVEVYPAGPTTSSEYTSFALSAKVVVPFPTVVEVESAVAVASFNKMPVVSVP